MTQQQSATTHLVFGVSHTCDSLEPSTKQMMTVSHQHTMSHTCDMLAIHRLKSYHQLNHLDSHSPHGKRICTACHAQINKFIGRQMKPKRLRSAIVSRRAIHVSVVWHSLPLGGQEVITNTLNLAQLAGEIGYAGRCPSGAKGSRDCRSHSRVRVCLFHLRTKELTLMTWLHVSFKVLFNPNYAMTNYAMTSTTAVVKQRSKLKRAAPAPIDDSQRNSTSLQVMSPKGTIVGGSIGSLQPMVKTSIHRLLTVDEEKVRTRNVLYVRRAEDISIEVHINANEDPINLKEMIGEPQGDDRAKTIV
eukprot:631378-Amphidinium_carterae.2